MTGSLLLCRSWFTAFLALVALLAVAGVSATVGSAQSSTPAPPIVFVVFDELPTVSLLDAQGRIDEALYPNFAALAKRSVWARNSSTVATRLLESMPALLTGRLPGAKRQASINAEFPDNLFTWLAEGYTLNVREPQSLLAPTSLTAPQQEKWLVDVRRDNHVAAQQGFVFRSFVKSMARHGRMAPTAKPSLDFLHVTLPYGPPRYTADGFHYMPHRMVGYAGGVWSKEGALIEDAWRRHLNEARYADELLGVLIEALEATGRFDESLIVVTSSYGFGFWPGESRRTASQTAHPEDVLLVPLFLKLPGQSAGRVVDDVVQSVDVVPTIADALARELPWQADGCSLLGECDRAGSRVSMRLDGSNEGRVVDRFADDLHLRRATLERKLALFPDASYLDRSWPAGRFEAWQGQPVENATAPGAVVAGTWSWDRAARRAAGGPRFVGHVELSEAAVDATARPLFAVSLGGRVEAMAQGVPDRRGRLVVRVMLPRDRVNPAGNDVALHVVEGETLRPLEPAKPRPKRVRPNAQSKNKKEKKAVPAMEPAAP